MENITFERIKNDEIIREYIRRADRNLAAMGYTKHSFGHVTKVAEGAAEILTALGYDERTCELARIAGYIHDVGNAVNRANHAMSGALLAFDVLRGLGMDIREVTAIITAIGNHDEKTAAAVTPLSAALILADKSDVRRSRVRAHLDSRDFDIHDRVNYAAVDSSLTVEKEQGFISLRIRIDTTICAVMDYFEIFLNRMTLCRSAAAFLGLDFELIINETRML